MIIKSVIGHRYTVPLAQPFSYFTASLSNLPYLLIEMTTNEGLFGYGEAALAWDVTGETQDGALASLAIILPLLIGKNITSINDAKTLMGAINLALYGNTGFKCGIESALLDCLGKELQQPIHKLVGGASQNSIIFQKTFSFDEIHSKNFQETASVASKLGVTAFKFKVGKDTNAEIAAIAQARSACPNSTIILDANQAWADSASACAFLNTLSSLAIAWVEQPVPAHDYESLAYIRSHCSVKVMADESCHTLQDLKALHALGAIDYVNLKLAKCGGIFELKKMIAYCEKNAVRYALGDMIHSSFGTAYNLHAAMLGDFMTYDLTMPSRIKNDWGTGLVFDGWKVSIPQSSGLGIELKNASACLAFQS